MTSNKDRLKSGLNKGPVTRTAVTAHNSLIPNLANINSTNNSSNNINNNIDVNTTTDTESVTTVQLHLVKDELQRTQRELVETKESNLELQEKAKQLESGLKSQLEEATSKIKELEAKIESLEKRLEESQSEVSKYKAELKEDRSAEVLRAELTALHETHDLTVKELNEAQQKIELLESQTRSAATGTTFTIEEYAKERLLRQLGQKKGDTYKQDGYYLDNDLKDRFGKLLKNVPFDKSTVINAAIAHILDSMGY